MKFITQTIWNTHQQREQNVRVWVLHQFLVIADKYAFLFEEWTIKCSSNSQGSPRPNHLYVGWRTFILRTFAEVENTHHQKQIKCVRFLSIPPFLIDLLYNLTNKQRVRQQQQTNKASPNNSYSNVSLRCLWRTLLLRRFVSPSPSFSRPFWNQTLFCTLILQQDL